MNANRVKFDLSFGSLLSLAGLTVLAMGMFIGAMAVCHPSASNRDRANVSSLYGNCQCERDTSSVGGLSIQKLPMPRVEVSSPVNPTTRDEVKHAGGGIAESKEGCPPGVNCNRSPVNWNQYTQVQYQNQPVPQYRTPMVIPSVVSSSNWPGQAEAESLATRMGARVVRVAIPGINSISVQAVLANGQAMQTYSGPNCFLAVLNDLQNVANSSVSNPGSQLPLAINNPQPQPQVPSLPAPTAKEGRHQLILFVNPGDQTSDMVNQWFASNPELMRLKANCATEIYTPGSAMYKARFANVVAAKDFPAILFLKPDAGHIYAVGRPMLPRSAEILVSDLREGLKLSESVRQSQVMMASHTRQAGAIKTTGGYNWDSMISDNMQLVKSQDFGGETGDCVDRDGDGACDTEPWQTGDRIRDILGGNKPHNPLSAMFAGWIGISEIIQAGLLLVILVLGSAVLYKMSSR